MDTEHVEDRDGIYYIAGKQISLDAIVHALRRGESPETICQNFESLRLEEVYGAIAFYLAHEADIEKYLHGPQPFPAELRERLLHARDRYTSRLA